MNLKPLKQMKRLQNGVMVVVAALMLNCEAATALAGRINFQGFITDRSGVAIGLDAPTTIPVVFRIYRTAGGSTPADILWAETQNVTIDRGYYSVVLGNGGPTGRSEDKFTNNLTSIFLGTDASERYLGVTPRGSIEMSPRVQFMSSPFAQGSYGAAGLTDANGKLAMSVYSGGLGINLTNAAQATLDVRGTINATAFVGDGTRVTNGQAVVANILGSISGGQIAEGAITTTALEATGIPGSAIAPTSLARRHVTEEAINRVLSQAGGVGTGGGVFSTQANNADLINRGFVNIGKQTIGGDRWMIRATEVTPNAPEPRAYELGSSDMRLNHSVWTGTKWIVWGGRVPGVKYVGTGAMFDPALNSWTPISGSGAPSARDEFQAVWIGDRMFLYGGINGAGALDGGWLYNPATDQWSQINSEGSAGKRNRFSAVWTGSEVIIFGGGNNSVWVNTGARYNPATDSWRPMAANPQGTRGDHCFQWTGTEMIVVGGFANQSDSQAGCNFAARYDPVKDQWTPMPPLPFNMASGYSAYTGTQLIAGLGWNSGGNRWAIYDFASNSWGPVQTTGSLFSAGRVWGAAFWSGSEFYIMGGWDGGSQRVECVRFNPASNQWQKLPDAPVHTTQLPFTWTGREFLVFGHDNSWSVKTVTSYSPPIELYQYVKQ